METTQKLIVLRLSLFSLGLVAMSVQIYFIREAIVLFGGNELVIGLCLGAWMVLTALGAYAGPLIGKADNSRHGGTNHVRFLILLLFAIMVITPIFLGGWMVYLKNMMLPPGAVAGLPHILFLLVGTISPFCIASGMLFPLLTDRLSAIRQKNQMSLAYALDSTGSILGGLLLGLVVFLWPGSTDHLPLKKWPGKMLYPRQEIIESANSPYGKLTLTRIAGQYSLYNNGEPILLAGDDILSEESVHYAMLLHPGPGNVLMIGGGTGGAIDEVFKYPVRRVDYLEINPWLIEMVNRHIPFPEDKRLRIINQDPRAFLAGNNAPYDVILVNAPDPNSAEVNRFYTREFFDLLKESMEPGGVVSLSVPAAGNYMNETSRQLHSVVYKTLKHSFSNIRIIPGNRDYFIASDRGLERSLWDMLKEAGFTNSYVNPQYINETLMEARGRLILESLSTDARTNTDLVPFVYLQASRQWLEQFGVDHRIIPGSLVVLVILGFIFLGPLNLGLFIGGFTSVSLEFILILWFQVIFGYAYQMTAVIFAIFMAGMSLGSFFREKILKDARKRDYLLLQVSLAILSILVFIFMQGLPQGPGGHQGIIALIFILVMATGALMGMLFSLSGQLRKTGITQSAGESFSADLLGSAIGIFLVSVYLVPQLGLPLTTLALAGLNLAAVGLVWRRTY